MTLTQLIERIRIESLGMASEPAIPGILDSELLIEVLLPRCIDAVVADSAADPNQLHQLRQDHTISFTAGVADLPESIEEQFIESAHISGGNETYNEYPSYKRDFVDYNLSSASRTPTFTVKNRKIYYRAANALSNAFTGNLVFNVITTPSIPASVSDTVVAKDSLLEKVIMLAASIISGRIEPGAIALDFMDMTPKRKFS